VIQLKPGRPIIDGQTIVAGEPSKYPRFDVRQGIEQLREIVRKIRLSNADEGIILVGDVGVTSHMGDILRHDEIPSWIKRSSPE
jgi:hypothetical protein